MRRETDKTRQIVFLLFGLVAVIMIFLHLQRSQPQPPPELANMPPGQRIAIIDSTYINLPFLFSIRMPNSKWHLEKLSTDTLLSPFDSTQAIANQGIWVARALRLSNSDTAAITIFAVLDRPLNMDVRNMSINFLAEIIANYESEGRTEVLQPVTEPAHAVLKGAYFAVELPESASNFPVHVFALMPRKNMLYVIKSQTTAAHYDELYKELEHMVRNLKPIPSLFTKSRD